MTLLYTAVVTLAVVAGLIHAVAKAKVRRIRANPDPYPVSVVGREPDGDEVVIHRPDGARLRARVHGGDGPTVVFVHGFTASILVWNLIWSLLRDTGHRLIAYDQRGHGQSTIGTDGVGSAQMASDLQAVLEQFDVRDGVLVGHSMGGFLATVFMLTHPEAASARLTHCVLLASFAGDVIRGAPQNRLQVTLFESGMFQRLARSQTYGSVLTASFYGPRPAPSGVEVYRQLLATQPLRPLTPILRAMMDENYYPRLSEIRLPCTVMYGVEDKTSPSWHGDALHRGIAGSRLERVEHAGHALTWEAPDTVAALIRSLGTKAEAPADEQGRQPRAPQ